MKESQMLSTNSKPFLELPIRNHYGRLYRTGITNLAIYLKDMLFAKAYGWEGVIDAATCKWRIRRVWNEIEKIEGIMRKHAKEERYFTKVGDLHGSRS